MSDTSEDTGGGQGGRRTAGFSTWESVLTLQGCLWLHGWEATVFKRTEEGLGGEEVENKVCSETQPRRWQGAVQSQKNSQSGL